MWTLLAVYIDLPGQQVAVGFKMLTQAAAGAGRYGAGCNI